jgi:hypothetical protein
LIYLPQALQIVSPLGALLHNGVVVVQQLAQEVAETPLTSGLRDEIFLLLIIIFVV